MIEVPEPLEEVYIAFNWQGPTGPLPNSTTPDLLTLASKIPGIQIPHTEYNLMDDRWGLITKSSGPFYNDSNFRVLGCNELRAKDKFILLFVLGHQNGFDCNFKPPHDIISESNTVNQTLDLIRGGNGYLVIDHALEAFVWDNHLNYIREFCRYHNLPMNKVIYVTGTGNTQKIYSEYVMRNGILPEDRMHLVQHFPSTQNFASDAYLQKQPEPLYRLDIEPSHLFLCFNKRSRMHRIVLATMFAKYNLLEHSLFSLQEHDENGNIKGNINMDMIQAHGLTHRDLDKLYDSFPLNIDNLNQVPDPIYDGDSDMTPFYQDSLVSVCTETSFHTNVMALTEKCIKPIKYKHPFILVATQGTLARLKEFGYKTFDTWWDEGYDDIIDHNDRMDAIVNICRDIATWDQEKIKQFRNDVKETLNHNYRIFIDNPWSRAYGEVYDIVVNKKLL